MYFWIIHATVSVLPVGEKQTMSACWPAVSPVGRGAGVVAADADVVVGATAAAPAAPAVPAAAVAVAVAGLAVGARLPAREEGTPAPDVTAGVPARVPATEGAEPVPVPGLAPAGAFPGADAVPGAVPAVLEAGAAAGPAAALVASGMAGTRGSGGSACRSVRSMAATGAAAPGAASIRKAPRGSPRRSAKAIRPCTDSALFRSTFVLRDFRPARRSTLARASAGRGAVSAGAVAGAAGVLAADVVPSALPVAGSVATAAGAGLSNSRSASTSWRSVPRCRATVSVAGLMPIRMMTSLVMMRAQPFTKGVAQACSSRPAASSCSSSSG